jgi:hypothetical protein
MREHVKIQQQRINGRARMPILPKDFNGFHVRQHVQATTTTSYCGYSTLPKYFLITTNIKYTDKNIARIGKWFKNNEVYDMGFPLTSQRRTMTLKLACDG